LRNEREKYESEITCDDTCSRFETDYECNRRTDRQTDKMTVWLSALARCQNTPREGAGVVHTIWTRVCCVHAETDVLLFAHLMSTVL